MMERLTAGARRLGIELSPQQTEQFETYYRELVEWNERVNLTAITEYEDVQIKHFLDSLTVTLALKESGGWTSPMTPTSTEGLTVLDVGTGAGLPGIPLKIAWPEIGLTLVEATAKKARFLEHLKHKLGLANTEIITGRAEDAGRLGRYRERFELVLSRAVAALPVLVELTLPFCAVDGLLVAQKQMQAKKEIDLARRAVVVLGGELKKVIDIDIDLPWLEGRCLVVYRKVSPTPAEYPRRPGVPGKRPIV